MGMGVDNPLPPQRQRDGPCCRHMEQNSNCFIDRWIESPRSYRTIISRYIVIKSSSQSSLSARRSWSAKFFSIISNNARALKLRRPMCLLHTKKEESRSLTNSSSDHQMQRTTDHEQETSGRWAACSSCNSVIMLFFWMLFPPDVKLINWHTALSCKFYHYYISEWFQCSSCW